MHYRSYRFLFFWHVVLFFVSLLLPFLGLSFSSLVHGAFLRHYVLKYHMHFETCARSTAVLKYASCTLFLNVVGFVDRYLMSFWTG